MNPSQHGMPWRWFAETHVHPTRLRIYRKLMEKGEMSPSQIAESLREPLATVSYHVRALEKHGMVVLKRSEPSRGSMRHIYAIRPVPEVYSH